MLLTTDYPNGKANLVIKLGTGSAGGNLIKRIPFTFENPGFGKPVEELEVTARLRSELNEATVVELFQGKPMEAWGLKTYDGTRDIYFGDARGHRFDGNMSTRGSHGKLLYNLNLGGGEMRRALMKWDLSILPKSTKIKKAVLMVYASAVPTKHRRAKTEPDKGFQVCAFRKPWHDRRAGIYGGYCSYRGQKTPANLDRLWPWEKDYFEGESDRSKEPVFEGELKATGWQEIEVTDVARKWLGNPAGNHGLVFKMRAEAKGNNASSKANLVSSDMVVSKVQRPRLVLAIEGKPKPVPAKVELEDSDLDAALAEAKKAKKIVAITFHTARLIAGRHFVRTVEEAKEAVAKTYVDVRVNADDPKNAAKLDKYGVKVLPAVVAVYHDQKGREMFERIEPLWWKNPTGYSLADFEVARSYLSNLAGVLKKVKGMERNIRRKRNPGSLRYRIEPDGEAKDINGPPGSGCG